MSDQTAPERIWLQTAGSYAEAHEATIGTETGVTWCDMQQDEGDQEYIRADLGSFYKESDIDALMNERDRLRALLAFHRIDPDLTVCKCGMLVDPVLGHMIGGGIRKEAKGDG